MNRLRPQSGFLVPSPNAREGAKGGSAAIDGAAVRSWQLRIFWLLWGAYASYYLCRVNFAVAQPLILKEFPSWTSAQVGGIPSIYAVFYAAGQIINGTLGQRYGARHMMTAALLIAATTNLLFSFTTSFSTMLVLWAINGFAQSAGWSLLVQVIANWNTSARRGTVVGFISTCYQVGNVISWLLAGFLCDSIGWRAAFAVPSLALLPMAAVFYFFLRNSPEEAGLPPIRDDSAIPDASARNKDATPVAVDAGWLSTWSILKLTLSNRILWILALGFFCMNSVRYTFMNWSVQYMADFQGRSIKNSALTAIAIPLIGSLGAMSAGWASDNVFGRRRAPVCAIMLIGLAGACALFTIIPQGQWLLATAILGVAGFLIYGPDMLMSGAATIDISHPKAASMATGLTMCFGATGAIFSGAGVGWLKDAAEGNWSLVFWVLTGLSLFSALLMVSIWNARPKGGR
jgi:MFS transporter, OPA family, glycerol-3-phosphate transporter